MLLIPGVAFAQSNEPVVLEPITVESDRGVQTETAVPSTIVDGEEIEGRQAGTIGELLDSVPGVTLVNGSTPSGSAINIRGFGAWSGTYGSDQMVKIQVDGASTGAEELYRIGTQFYTDPALYKRVEVIRGSVGTFEYGSGAVGGLVRLTTKDASDFTGGEVGHRFREYLGFGSNGEGFVSSSTVALQPTENAEFLANYTHRQQNNMKDGTGATIGNTTFKTPSYLVKGKVHFGYHNEHSLSLSHSNTESAERDVPYDQFGTAAFGNVDRDIKSRTTVLDYGYNPADTDLVNVGVTVSRADQDIEQSPVSGSGGLLDADHRFVTSKVTIKNTARFFLGATDHNPRVGVEFVERDRQDASSAPGGVDERRAVFLVDDIAFDGFTLSPAVRYENQRIDGSEYGRGVYNNDALMGGVSLRHEWSNGFALFGSVAYTENLPILDDLNNPIYMERSQKARTYEVGGSYRGSGLIEADDAIGLKLNAYHTDVWDITSYSGVTDVKVQGVEVEAAYSMRSGLYADLNAHFSRGTDETSGASPDYWEQTPADQVRLGLGKRFQNSLSVKWEGVYNRRMDRSSTPTSGNVIHHVSTSYFPRTGFFEGFEFRASIENLMDTDYQPHLATRPAPGRNIKLSIAKTF